MSRRSILFVFANESAQVKDGITTVLNRRQNEWLIKFVDSGEEALAVMEKQTYEVLITELQLPGIDGVELLQRIGVDYPGTIRFVLSEDSERKLMVKALGSAHRSIPKPCDPEKLRQLLNTSLGLRALLTHEDLHIKIATIGALPSLPSTYHKLTQVLQSEDSSIKAVADLISQDVALTAKLLQMVNSAFFGLQTRIESTVQAVNMLGLDMVKGLVLTAGAFAQFDVPGIAGMSLESIYSHSLAVGATSQKVARKIGISRIYWEEAMTAGLLHDIGKLVMLAHFRKEMAEALKISIDKNIPLQEAERRVLSVDHADIGAHLLSLWGLPDSILEPVALHHNPRRIPCFERTVLTAVHIANALHAHADGGKSEPNPDLDVEYLTNMGLVAELPALRDECMIGEKVDQPG